MTQAGHRPDTLRNNHRDESAPAIHAIGRAVSSVA